MNKKAVIIVVVILIIIGGLYAFKSKDQKADNQNKNNLESYTIGVMAPLSGPISAYGEEAKRGIAAALASSTQIKVIYEDDVCDPKTAVAAYKKLTELDKVKVIIGPLCGAPQKAIAPLVKNTDVLVMLPSAAPESVFEESGGSMYNTQYSLEDESTFIANKMGELGYKKVALITYKNAFSEVHANTFNKNYKGEIVKTISLDDVSTNIDTDLLKLSKEKFDAIYVTDISFYFAGGMEKLKNNKISVPVFSPYVVELPVARPLVDGVIYSFPENVMGDDGGTFELSKETAKTIIPLIIKCDGSTACIKQELSTSQMFNSNGVAKRNLVLKQINGDKVEIYK